MRSSIASPIACPWLPLAWPSRKLAASVRNDHAGHLRLNQQDVDSEKPASRDCATTVGNGFREIWQVLIYQQRGGICQAHATQLPPPWRKPVRLPSNL